MTYTKIIIRQDTKQIPIKAFKDKEAFRTWFDNFEGYLLAITEAQIDELDQGVEAILNPAS